ncbi:MULTISPECIES: phosphate signaling complex protein PhoU [unclassified Oscillibacter]|uniref:phosphate signaling complex protein PhoU n=1 Tax=unclassified Oscillibacter TaxID=2629304 RepID=UPI0025CF1446|nr:MULTISPECIES: phosphate signaling complex protein PhoU [unclassified Oscillibacter]
MRSRFDRQLETLNTMLIEMGMQVETAIAASIEALRKQDTVLAKKAIAADTEIDQQEKDIEAMCLKLLLQQQPVAKDLRLISAALKMITDMERIGDQAADIAEISIFLTQAPHVKTPEHIPQMAAATAKMVTESIDAFVKKDLELANKVIADDDVVDRLFDAVKSDLIKLMSADSSNGSQAIDLLMIAKYLERIGDHATNIAEWVVFSITGKHEDAAGSEG